MYDRIVEALDSLNLQNCLKSFEENEVDDACLEDFLKDGSIYRAMTDILPKAGPREKFIKKFKSLLYGDATADETTSIEECISEFEDIRAEGNALILKALGNYRDEMENLISAGIDKEAFDKFHQRIKISSIDMLKKSDRNFSEILMEKFSTELELKIAEVHVELVYALLENKNEMDSAIRQAKEDAKEYYEDSMKEFFDQLHGPIQEINLEIMHNVLKSEANNRLSKFYESKKIILKDWKNEEVSGLLEVEKVIETLFSKFKEANTLSLSAHEAKAKREKEKTLFYCCYYSNYLTEAKTEYDERLKKLMDATNDLEELKTSEISLRGMIEKKNLEKLNPNNATPELIKTLHEHLEMCMENRADEIVEAFQFQQKEDEIAVKMAMSTRQRNTTTRQ